MTRSLTFPIKEHVAITNKMTGSQMHWAPRLVQLISSFWQLLMFSSPHRRPKEIFSVIFKCYVIICFEELKPPPVYVWNVLHYWTQMVWNHLFYWVIFRCTCQGSGPVCFYILIPSLVKNNNLLLEKPFATDYFSPVSRLITRPSELTQWRNRQERKL